MFKKSCTAIAVGLLISGGAAQAGPAIDVNGSTDWLDTLAPNTEMHRISVTDDGNSTDPLVFRTQVGDGTGTIHFGSNANGSQSLIKVYGNPDDSFNSRLGMQIDGGIHFHNVRLTGNARLIDVGVLEDYDKKAAITVSGPLLIESSTSDDSVVVLNSDSHFGDITVRETTAGSDVIKLFNSSHGQNPFGTSAHTANNILFDRVTSHEGNGITAEYASSLNIASLEAVNSDFVKGGLLYVRTSEDVAIGSVKVSGTPEDRFVFASGLFIVWEGSGLTLGDVTIEHVTNNYNSSFPPNVLSLSHISNKVSLGNIRIDDAIFTGAKGISNAALHLGGMEDDFRLASAEVTNVINEYPAGNSTFEVLGIDIDNVKPSEQINSLTVKNVTTSSGSQYSELIGIRIRGSDFLAGVGNILVDGIHADGAVSSYGLQGFVSTINVTNEAVIKDITTDNGTATGLRLFYYEPTSTPTESS